MFELRCMSDGPYFRRTFPVRGSGATVGRAEDNDVCVPDDSISSSHAIFLLDESGDICVRDQGSTNGTRVNRNEVTESKIRNGDEVEFGNLVFRVAGLVANQATVALETAPAATTLPIEAPPKEVPSLPVEIERIAPREPLRLAQPLTTPRPPQVPPPAELPSAPVGVPAPPVSPPAQHVAAGSGFHWTSPSVGWTVAALSAVGIVILLCAVYIHQVMHVGP